MRIQHKRRTPRGVIFVISIVSMAVMMMIGTIFMSLAVGQFNDARRDVNSLHAIAMADAGLNYMIYLKQQDPSTDDIASGDGVDLRTLSPDDDNPDVPPKALGDDEGSFAVWLFSVPGNTEAYQIVSQGYYRRGHNRENDVINREGWRTVRTLVRAPVEDEENEGGEPEEPPTLPDMPVVFDYAFFSDGGLDIKSQSVITGKIGSNDNIGIKNKATVTSDAFVSAGHVVNNKGTLGGTVVTGPNKDFPVINMQDYKKYAQKHGGLVINGNWNLPAGNGGSSTFTFPAKPGNVVFVDGNVNITSNMTFNGIGTIVATGDVNFGSHVRSQLGTNASLVIISGKDTKFTAHCEIEAALLTLGYYRQTSHVKVTGAIIAKDSSFSTAHSTVTYKKPSTDAPIIPPPSDEGGGNNEEDPGGDINAWTVASWELL